MSYNIVVSDSNGLHNTKKITIGQNYTEHRCPNDISIKILYNEDSDSQFYNEIVSKLMLRNVRGRAILYRDNENLVSDDVLSIYNKLSVKPSWASLARQITEDDSKRMADDTRRVNNELKLTEKKINAVLSPSQYDDFYYEFDDDEYDEYD